MDTAVCKCAASHFDEDALVLPSDTTLSNESILYVILSCKAHKNHHRKLKKQLIHGGARKRNISVVYGFNSGMDRGGVKAFRGIMRLSFKHKWLPHVAKRLGGLRGISCVMYLEATALLQTDLAKITEFVSSIESQIT